MKFLYAHMANIVSVDIYLYIYTRLLWLALRRHEVLSRYDWLSRKCARCPASLNFPVSHPVSFLFIVVPAFRHLLNSSWLSRFVGCGMFAAAGRFAPGGACRLQSSSLSLFLLSLCCRLSCSYCVFRSVVVQFVEVYIINIRNSCSISI